MMELRNSAFFTVVNQPDNMDDISGSLTVTLEGSVGSSDTQVVLTCLDEAL